MTSLSLNLLNPFQSSCLMSGRHLTLFVLLTTYCTFRFNEIHLPSDLLLSLSPWQMLPVLSSSLSSQGSLPGSFLSPAHGSWAIESIPIDIKYHLPPSPHLCPHPPILVSYNPSGVGLDGQERLKVKNYTSYLISHDPNLPPPLCFDPVK